MRERDLLGDEAHVLELGHRIGRDAQRGVPERIGPFGQERRPGVQVGARGWFTAQADVVVVRVDDGGAGVEAARAASARISSGVIGTFGLRSLVLMPLMAASIRTGVVSVMGTHAPFVRSARRRGADPRATSSISSSVQTASGMWGYGTVANP